MNVLETHLLRIGYEAGGPSDGPRVRCCTVGRMTYGLAQVGTVSQKAGFQWTAPYLRGFGPTEFLSTDTLRDGSAPALAQDAIDFVDCRRPR